MEVLRRLRGSGPSRAADPGVGGEAVPFTRELGPTQLARDALPVTTALYNRLSVDDVAAVERSVRESPESPITGLETRDPGMHRFQVLSYGMWLGIPEVAAKTGLLAAQPPPEVHAMTRGPEAAAGGLYEADLIVGALESAGASMDAVRTGLDFGCSSGRVVRVLAAAYPHIRWRGCDPNEGAVAWASENLPSAEFFVSPQHPPTSLPDGSLDVVYAISVWSHFAPDLGLRWFTEMRRLLAPGGYLVCTTHGLDSVAMHAAAGLRTSAQTGEITRALCARGWWYASEFGAEGDWGVIDPEWGTAFLSTEWILTKLCPAWRVLEFAPGRNGHQDVYVLQRA